jgi:hypothetical protein
MWQGKEGREGRPVEVRSLFWGALLEELQQALRQELMRAQQWQSGVERRQQGLAEAAAWCQ